MHLVPQYLLQLVSMAEYVYCCAGETIVKELKTQSERDEVLQEVFNIDLAAV